MIKVLMIAFLNAQQDSSHSQKLFQNVINAMPNARPAQPAIYAKLVMLPSFYKRTNVSMNVLQDSS
jgi:hypothetical protein